MRYIIIGAGAVGGTIGARLFESGHEVVLVARGAHLAALRDGGLRFATPDRAVTLPVPAVAGPDELELRTGDVLILTVKTQDAAAALNAWAWQPVTGSGVAADSLPVFCAQNGVASEPIALRLFRRVYGVCVWLPATHLEPGAVEAQCTPMSGLLPVGRYPSGADDTAHEVAADLAKSKFLAPVSETVMRYKYDKLVANLGNAIEAVCGPSSAQGPNAASDLFRRTREEGEAVLDAAGIDRSSLYDLVGRHSDQVKIEPVNGAQRSGGSSWQSLSRGTGSIEADFLNGEIVLLGREHGIAAPLNERLQRLANEFARDRRTPGSITDEELALLTRPGGAG